MSGTERGSTAVETALLMPTLMILVALVVAGGRVWFARATVTDAAYAAARAASLSANPLRADERARAVFAQSVATAGLRCRDQTLTLDASGFVIAPGRPARVGVSVRCVVVFDDLLLPSAPALPLEVHAESALDTYRERR